MKPHHFVYIFILLFFSACMGWPRETKTVDDQYYYIRETRGFAFTNTVYDYEFYEKRKWLWGKKLGNIVLFADVPADSVEISQDSLTGFNRVIFIRKQSIILDSLFNFSERFDVDIQPNWR